MPRKFEPWPDFQRRLRIAMYQREMTAADLMRATGMGAGQISNYLNGYQEPGATRIVAFCKALDVSADFLLGLTSDMKPKRRK